MRATLLSWGRYPHHPQTPHPVRWRSDVGESLATLQRTIGTTLPFGNGRSYGDSCLADSGHVLATRSLDRFIAADWERGVVVVEPGLTLGELLAVTVPKGWFLRVTPGTQFATIGGAIANDVHGKNHHRQGTFGCHVPRFGLWRSEEGLLTCSARENSELYSATIGGLGLTGLIVWAEIQLGKIDSSHIRFVTQRFDSIDEFFALCDELDPIYEFGVAWVDCTARGSSALGRGYYSAGEFWTDGELASPAPRAFSVPITPPFSLVNRFSLPLFNEAIWRKHSRTRQSGSVGFQPFLYPLDGINDWNRMYGRGGFQQYQCVLPHDAAESGTKALLSAIATSGNGSFLAVLKRFGDYPSPGLLSFPRPGVTLAVDFRNQPELDGLFQRLDRIVRDARGRIYPAKDAHVGAADFQSSYPQWPQLEALRDPALNSRFWKRVTQCSVT